MRRRTVSALGGIVAALFVATAVAPAASAYEGWWTLNPAGNAVVKKSIGSSMGYAFHCGLYLRSDGGIDRALTEIDADLGYYGKCGTLYARHEFTVSGVPVIAWTSWATKKATSEGTYVWSPNLANDNLSRSDHGHKGG